MRGKDSKAEARGGGTMRTRVRSSPINRKGEYGRGRGGREADAIERGEIVGRERERDMGKRWNIEMTKKMERDETPTYIL